MSSLSPSKFLFHIPTAIPFSLVLSFIPLFLLCFLSLCLHSLLSLYSITILMVHSPSDLGYMLQSSRLQATCMCNMWMYVVRVPYVCVHGTCGMNMSMCVHMCMCICVYVHVYIMCVPKENEKRTNKSKSVSYTNHSWFLAVSLCMGLQYNSFSIYMAVPNHAGQHFRSVIHHIWRHVTWVNIL